MNEQQLKEIASQLRQPHGDGALEIAGRMNKGNVHMNQETIKALKIQKQDSILELGMGNGFFVKDILSVDPSVIYTGYDFSEKMVDEAGRINESYIKEGRASFVLGNAEAMPFADNQFDKAFTVNTIYFWENRSKVFAEFRRVLKPGGKLFITVRPKRIMEQYPFVKYGFNMFSKEELIQLIEENKFSVIQAIENQEPPQEINGQKYTVESLILIASR